MRRLCLIPARGGSKRIPRKNLKPFCGRPIIAYSIRAALESGLFNTVMVSTDDAEIAELAREHGAEIPFLRSPEAANDHATTLDVIREVLDRYRSDSRLFAEVVCIYATAPFVTPELLTQAVDLRARTNAECVFPVIRYGFPVQRSLELNADGRIRLRYPEHVATRSQDLPPVYHDAGMFYCFDPEVVLQQNRLWTDNTRAIEVDELAAHDIDTPEDWALAEMKYRLLRGR